MLVDKGMCKLMNRRYCSIGIENEVLVDQSRCVNELRDKLRVKCAYLKTF